MQRAAAVVGKPRCGCRATLCITPGARCASSASPNSRGSNLTWHEHPLSLPSMRITSIKVIPVPTVRARHVDQTSHPVTRQNQFVPHGANLRGDLFGRDPPGHDTSHASQQRCYMDRQHVFAAIQDYKHSARSQMVDNHRHGLAGSPRMPSAPAIVAGTSIGSSSVERSIKRAPSGHAALIA